MLVPMLKSFWADENGAHLVEYVIGLILLAAAASTFGLAMMAASRSKSADIMSDVESFSGYNTANDAVIKPTSGNEYAITETGNIGLPHSFEKVGD